MVRTDFLEKSQPRQKWAKWDQNRLKMMLIAFFENLSLMFLGNELN